jgi:hypothetical protein
VWAGIGAAALWGWQGLMGWVHGWPLGSGVAIGFAQGAATGLYLLTIWLLVTRL